MAPSPEADQVDETAQPGEAGPAGFSVRVGDFDGPFDLLLTLITKRRLDITEVALSAITDEFLAYLRGLDTDSELDEASEFLVVAATLLDLKVAGLLPQGELVDAEDVALLEARDLLFARLLQYRAYKRVAAMFVEMEGTAARRFPRSVALEERFAALLPEVLLGVDAAAFADLAASVFRPKPPPTPGLDHLHQHEVSVAEHAALLRERLAELGAASFADLTADCVAPIEVVARFLAVLDLYRTAAVELHQPEPFGELTVTWTPA